MSAMLSFGYGEQLVRVFDREGDPWFVGKDVCGALELVNHKDALSRLDDDERDGVGITDAIGRQQETTIISESGVFALIFTSRKEAAKKFRKWVTGEVLPAIRRTGRFEMTPPETSELHDDEKRLSLSLQMVREARLAFGRRAAQEAWRLAGLPDVDRALVRAAVADGRIDCSSVEQWFAERIELDPDARESAAALKEDYGRWCAAQGRTPVTETALGSCMRRLGTCHVHDRTGRVVRVGIRLKPAQ